MQFGYKDVEQKISSVLLCAGQSSRMGQEKALLKVGHETVITKILNNLCPISDLVIIVVGKNFELIKEHLIKSYLDLKNIHFTINKNADKGIFTSIKKGLTIATTNKPTLLHMIDQPFVPKEIYEQLIESLDDEHQIFQPSTIIDGIPRAGHPIIFNHEFRDHVLKQPDEANLRDLVRDYSDRRKFLEVDDKRILQNLNTIDEFEKQRKNYEE